MKTKNIIWIIVVACLIGIVATKIVSAITCYYTVIVYDPNHNQVAKRVCPYDNETTQEINCSITYRKCFVTGLYTLYINDSAPGCTGIETEDPWFLCDATPPNIKGTSPVYFSASADNTNNEVDASWKVYDDGLLVYLPFEHDTAYQVLDHSQNGHNANITGALEYIPGYYGSGSAGHFDGTNDYLEIKDDLGDPAGMTIAFWLNATDLNDGAEYLLDGRNGGNWWLMQDYVSGSCVDGNGNICMDGRAEINSSQINESNKWWHIAIVQNATITKMYLNGENVANGTGEDPDLGENVTIGASYTYGSQLEGSLDEIYIYNRTLSYEEIVNLYMSGLIRHETYRAPTTTSTYEPTEGHFDDFSSGSGTDYIESGDLTNVDWSYSNVLKSTVNETYDGGYAYVEYQYLDVSGKDILIEYDVTFNGAARTGGVYYRGVRCEVNPNMTGWRDDDNSTFYDGVINQSGTQMHIKLYIYANRSGYPVSSLYVNREYRFYDEIINKSTWPSTRVGFYSNKYNDSVEIDNFKVTILHDTLQLSDTDAVDITGPSPPTSVSVASNSLGTLTVSWNDAVDNGDDYYFYLIGYDYQDNPTNMLDNHDFEANGTSPWQGYSGGAIGTTSEYPHFGNYSLNVSASGAGEGVSQSISNYADYKGYYVYWGCWAKAKTGTLGVSVGGDGLPGYTNYTLTTTWQFIKTVDQVDTEATELEVYIKTNESAGEFYLDDCVLQALRSATVTSGIKDYYVDETSGNTGGDDETWDTDKTYTDYGLDCFSQYTYRVKARDNQNNEGSYSSSVSEYPIPSDTCTYGSGAAGYCLDDVNNECYYPSDPGGSCDGDYCEDPGVVAGDDCYYDTGDSVDRSDDCTSSGCTGVSYETHPNCDNGGDFTTSYANCWGGTNCYWNNSNPCSSGSGWEYTTSSTYCDGVSTCCPTQAEIAEGVNCTSTGATGTTYDRDTTEARCESTATGCVAQVWTNISNTCCGDDGLNDDFCDVGYEEGVCTDGNWSSNHCEDGVQNCGETSVDYGGPWCNDRPSVSSALLNSSNGTNKTDENLTVYYSASDNDYDELFEVVDWRVNSNSLAVLNMPFQVNNDSSALVRDFSTYENNGTNHGANWTRFGYIGGAYEFNGSGDYIEIPDNPSLDITENLTVMAWIYPNYVCSSGSDGDPCVDTIVSKDGFGSGYWLMIYYSGNRLLFEVNGSGGGTLYSCLLYTSPSPRD